MAISNPSSRSSTVVADGVETDFSTEFYFLEATDVVVRVSTDSGATWVTQTLGVQYTVDLPSGVDQPGLVKFTVAPAAGALVYAEREVPFVQETDFRDAGTFSAKSHEDQFDRLVFQTQQLDRRLSTLEDGGANGDFTAGDGLYMDGTVLHVGAGAGLVVGVDQVSVAFDGGAAPITATGGGDGTAETAARSDHGHTVSTAAPSSTAVRVGNSASVGASSALARADHQHAVAAGVPVNVTKSAAAEGAAVTFARSDHKHDVTTAAATGITDSTNAEGTATSLARSDHQHSHGTRAGGSLHALAIAGSSAGFMSGSDKAKLDGLVVESQTEVTTKTTNATTTTVLYVSPNDDTVESIDVRCVGISEDGTNVAGYNIRALVKRKSGTTTIINQESVVAAIESNAALDCSFGVASPNCYVQVTGLADTGIWWKVQVRRLSLGTDGK